jgi:glycosyltransferase involved in cell wall biosynthesis
MTNSPFFSVVIPVYNRAHLIERTIRSVTTQEFDDFEIIVVDDGSTDNAEMVISGIGDQRLRYCRKTNQERAAARNFGVREAKGKYITFLDSDDTLFVNHLRVAKRKLAELGEPEVYHQSYQVEGTSGEVLSRLNLGSGIINEFLFTRGNVMSCMGVFLKREVALTNPFNENPELTGVEDWELWIRLSGRYSIFHDSLITAAIINHEERSVNRVNEDKLIASISCLLSCVIKDVPVRKKYESFFNRFKASAYSYISLQLSESSVSKKKSIAYLVSAIRIHPGVLLRRRTLAILRNLLVI